MTPGVTDPRSGGASPSWSPSPSPNGVVTSCRPGTCGPPPGLTGLAGLLGGSEGLVAMAGPARGGAGSTGGAGAASALCPTFRESPCTDGFQAGCTVGLSDPSDPMTGIRVDAYGPVQAGGPAPNGFLMLEIPPGWYLFVASRPGYHSEARIEGLFEGSGGSCGVPLSFNLVKET